MRAQARAAEAQPGGFGAAGGAAGQGGFGRGQGGGRRGLVFVSKDGKYSPRTVRLGVSNFDYSEVLSGVQEGEQVAILNVAVLQARQQENLNQVRGRGMPGMQRQQPATGGAGGAGGAGGGAGGAGSRGGAGGQRTGGGG